MESKERVRAHWEAQPCGSGDSAAPIGTPAYFAGIEAARYQSEPFIPSFAQFWRWRDKRVLEVGIGQGTDYLQFVRAGARCTGLDLTEASISLVGQRLRQEGLDAEVVLGDAERLPFDDESFDLVYSWGVLHHTPHTQDALREARRVLAPDGEARIMLYNRRSWTALWHWCRYGLAAGHPMRSFSDVLAEHMESPGTKAYSRQEINDLFAGWSQIDVQSWLTPYDCRLVPPLVRASGDRFGWFFGIIAKP